MHCYNVCAINVDCFIVPILQGHTSSDTDTEDITNFRGILSVHVSAIKGVNIIL